MTITKASAADSGCITDGHWGQYGPARMIEIAAENGWEDSEYNGKAITIAKAHLSEMGGRDSNVIISENDYDYMYWAADEAEQWLNDNVAPEGYSFGWHDGEFYLWSTESWEES